ncbi:MAG: hypothetical protein LUQ68_06100, partial [Methylococcaceae bacterium]|nr:hypothetical protein [Methylococcaceae bacterium]
MFTFLPNQIAKILGPSDKNKNHIKQINAIEGDAMPNAPLSARRNESKAGVKRLFILPGKIVVVILTGCQTSKSTTSKSIGGKNEISETLSVSSARSKCIYPY